MYLKQAKIWARQSVRGGFPDKVAPQLNFREQIGGSPVRKVKKEVRKKGPSRQKEHHIQREKACD